ncbi:MAG: hypothetical protein QXP91_02800 [Candidatus Methanomethylicia archaeon]
MEDQEKPNMELTLSIPIIPEENNTSKNIDNDLKQNIETVRNIISDTVNAAVKVVLKEANRLHQSLMIQMVKVTKELNTQTTRINREITRLSSKVADISENIMKLNEIFMVTMKENMGNNSKSSVENQIMEFLKNLGIEIKSIAEENIKIAKTINELKENLNINCTVAKPLYMDAIKTCNEIQTLLKTSIEQLNELKKHIEELSIILKELIKTLKSENVIKDIRGINVMIKELVWYMEELKSNMA